MTKGSGISLGMVGMLCASAAMPGAIRTLDVTRESGRYHLVANSYLDAPPEAIYRVLVDYENDHFGRISEVYKESDYLAPDRDGTPLVFTRVEGCLLFFCRSMRRVERLEVVEPTFIRTTTLPERSDFKFSRSEWLLEAEEGGTRVIYRLDMEPNFWLPPFVGPWFLKKTLLRGGAVAVDRIEELAVEEAAAVEATAESATAARAAPTLRGQSARRSR